MARIKRAWMTPEQFYSNAKETGRYGGEVDFGMMWATDATHYAGRLTWIPESGEWYLAAGRNDRGRYESAPAHQEIMLLGMTEPNNREMAENLMRGWAEACLAREGIRWIDGRLGVHAQTYRTLELATRAYAREGHYQGAGGGWIYQWDATRPICQGWGALGTLLVRRGHIRKAPEGDWRIVDNRSMEARQRTAHREVTRA